jgi:hypothetical protein
MQEKKATGRRVYNGTRVGVILNPRTEEMLAEIQEYIGATSMSEAVRFLIQNFYNEKMPKNKP